MHQILKEILTLKNNNTMKNIFKLMGVALIASSMLFVSCNKTEEEETNTNTNTPTTPEVTYKLTLKVNDGAMGSIAAVPQKDAYKKGDTVVVTATANDGYKFVSWEDGTKDNPRTIVFADANITVTAGFAEQVPDHATVTFNETTWTPTTWAAGMYNGNLLMQLHEQYQANDKPYMQIVSAHEVGTFTHVNGQDNYGWLYWNYPGESATYNGQSYAKWQREEFTEVITEIDMNTTYMVFTATGSVYDLQAYADEEPDVIMPLSVDVAGTWTAVNWSKKNVLK